MAVDKDEKRVNAVLPFVMNAQIGDATNEEFLESLGVNNFDVCIVAIGDDFQSSLETTSLLKELDAKKIVSRAAREVHAQNSFCETVRMKSYIPKGSLRIGRLSAILPTISSIT